MNPNDSEKRKIVNEWIEKAKADLDSAKVLLKDTNHYEIVVYHSHQAIEKFFKAKLIENNKDFKFTHDLNSLYFKVCKFLSLEIYKDDISFINSLYPRLRYPTGDKVSKDDADRSMKLAKNILEIV